MSPLAVVTGASSGIGLALAREFAAHGYELVLAADEPIPIEGEHVIVDLATRDGVEALHAQLRGRRVDALVLDAGITARSDDLERELRLVDLNVRSFVHLARLVSAERMLFTSSIVADMPGPNQAAYHASKAFIETFALGLRYEGVRVTVLMPRATDTPIFARAGQARTRLGASRHKDDPADVARAAYAALMAGHKRVVMGRTERLAAKLLPEALVARVVELATRPR